jgi:hypothetical protein
MGKQTLATDTLLQLADRENIVSSKEGAVPLPKNI